MMETVGENFKITAGLENLASLMTRLVRGAQAPGLKQTRLV